MAETPLGKRLREVAKTTSSEIATDLIAKAEAFERAGLGFYSEPQTHDAKQFLGAWARARKALCLITGEDLI